MGNVDFKTLTMAGSGHFSTRKPWGRGMQPPRVSKLSAVKLCEKAADCSRRVLTIGAAFFDILGQYIFDSVIGKIFAISAIFSP